MLAYWEARRENGAAAPRSSIDPAQFADVVTQVFMIGRERAGVFPFRLAGALLDDLHRGPLTGLTFDHLWTVDDRPRLQASIESAMQRQAPLLLHAQGRTARGDQARIEILLSPLSSTKGGVDRLLGHYQPVSPLFRLQEQKIERLFLLEAVMADGSDATTASVRLASLDGRNVA
jgi:hypothetical protein